MSTLDFQWFVVQLPGPDLRGGEVQRFRNTPPPTSLFPGGGYGCRLTLPLFNNMIFFPFSVCKNTCVLTTESQTSSKTDNFIGGQEWPQIYLTKARILQRVGRLRPPATALPRHPTRGRLRGPWIPACSGPPLPPPPFASPRSDLG